MELLQSLTAPRVLLFASTLQGPAAYLPAPNKTPRARYSAQSISKASPCSHTEAESQMRGINEHRPPVSALKSARREGRRARGGRAGTVCCSSTSTNEPAAPQWDTGGEPAQTNQLGPMMLPMGLCLVGAKGWTVPLGWAETRPVISPWRGAEASGCCQIPAGNAMSRDALCWQQLSWDVLQPPPFCTWPAVQNGCSHRFGGDPTAFCGISSTPDPWNLLPDVGASPGLSSPQTPGTCCQTWVHHLGSAQGNQTPDPALWQQGSSSSRDPGKLGVRMRGMATVPCKEALTRTML